MNEALTETTRTTLTKTKAALERYGWIQGEYGGEDEGFCLVGAIEHAAWAGSGGYSGAYTAKWLACAALSGCLGDEVRVPTGAVINWNDSPRRTKEQVFDLIDRTGSGDCPPPEGEKGTK